jgi:hypothetical protein
MSPVAGLGCTPLNTVTGIPAASSTPVTLATTAVAASAESVTTTAVSLPVPWTMPGSLPRTPAPTYAAGVGMITISDPAMAGITAGGIVTPVRVRRCGAGCR